MPSCVARGCSWTDGRLKLFPRHDPKRRQIWIERVNRSDWIPTKYSGLCEKHFDKSQWEIHKPSGKQKLKSTAVPTVFCIDTLEENDVISVDHAYCMRGYRQFYPENDYYNSNWGKERKKKARTERPSSPVEVKAEPIGTDSNEYETEELPSLESVKIKEEKHSDGEEEREGDEVAEDIQCTPDIVLSMRCTEQLEPEPMEMVDCEDDDPLASMSEPSIDPLAISADDLDLSKEITPHFAHSKKFLFVTKDTKYIAPMQDVVTGESVIVTKQPMVKIPTPPKLFKPNQLILYENPLSVEKRSHSKPPKLHSIIKKSPPLAPTLAQSKFSPTTNKIICLQTEPISPLSVKVIPTPENKLLLKKMKFNQSKIRPVKLKSEPKRIVIPSRTTLEPSPECLRPRKLLLKTDLMGSRRLLCVKSAIESISNHKFKKNFILKDDKPNIVVKRDQNTGKLVLSKGEECGLKSQTVLSADKNDKVNYGDDEVADEKLSSDDEMSKIPNSYCRQKPSVCSPKYVKLSPVKESHSTSDILNDQTGCMVSTKNPKVIVVKIAKPNKKTEENFFTRMEEKKPPVMTRQSKNRRVYRCNICNVLFLFYTTLRIHMFTKHKQTDLSLSLDWQIIENKNQGSITKLEPKKILAVQTPKKSDTKSESSGNKQRRNFSRMKATIRNKKFVHPLSFIGTKPVNVQEYKNDLVLIPNINALHKSEEEFIRLTKLVTSKGEKKSDSETESANSETVSATSDNVSVIDSDHNSINLSHEELSLSEGSPTLNETKKKCILPIASKSSQPSENKLKSIQTRSKVGVNKSTKMNNNNYENNNRAKHKITKEEEKDPDEIITENKRISTRSQQTKNHNLKIEIKTKQSNVKKLNKLKKDLKSTLVTDSPKLNRREKRLDSKSQNNKKEATKKDEKQKQSGSQDSRKLRSKTVLPINYPFACTKCSQRFIKSFELRKHITAEHSKKVLPFVCARRDCSRKFETKRELDKHTRVHKK